MYVLMLQFVPRSDFSLEPSFSYWNQAWSFNVGLIAVAELKEDNKDSSPNYRLSG